MVTKTSVLLSWEFPENYNSPTPYKASGMGESELCFFPVSWESCLPKEVGILDSCLRYEQIMVNH